MSKAVRQIVFVDDDPHEIATFEQLYQSGEMQVTAVHVPDPRDVVTKVRNALEGTVPHLFVLDLYFPVPPLREQGLDNISQENRAAIESDFKRLEDQLAALKHLFETAPDDGGTLLRDAHGLASLSRGILDNWCRLLGQSADGGIALLESLDVEYPDVPKVFYSRKATIEDVKNALGAGATDVILKPHPSQEQTESTAIREAFIEYSELKPPAYLAKWALKKFNVRL